FVLQLQGKLEEALACYRKAIQLNPNDAVGQNNLAWQLATAADVNLRNPAEAVKLARRAVELDPKNETFPSTLGAAHYRAADFKSAIAALEKSMAMRHGGDGTEWFFLAMAHWQLGDKDEARKWYGQAADWIEKNSPQNEELRRFQAEAAELLGIKTKEP